jgi:hypothetical protein
MKATMNLPPQLVELIPADRACPLGPGTPNAEAYPRLKALRAESLFGPSPLRDRELAACCLAGLWLLHNYLDESHRISQEIETVEGSYWHALMHRREPDYGNSKYWFRRVGSHPVFADLHAQAREVAARQPEDPAARQLAALPHWDPALFVDLCQHAAGGPGEAVCVQVQAREWRLLFDFCARGAVGG